MYLDCVLGKSFWQNDEVDWQIRDSTHLLSIYHIMLGPEKSKHELNVVFDPSKLKLQWDWQNHKDTHLQSNVVRVLKAIGI